MAKEVLERNEINENKLKEKKAVVAGDAAAILQWVMDAKSIKCKPQKTRMDIVFFTTEEMPIVQDILEVLSQTTESVTTLQDVTPRSKHLS